LSALNKWEYPYATRQSPGPKTKQKIHAPHNFTHELYDERGKNIAKAAKSASTGVELEHAKVRRDALTKQYKTNQQKYEKNRVYFTELRALSEVFGSNTASLGAYKEKLLQSPVEDIVLRDTYTRIVAVLTANAAALQKEMDRIRSIAGDVDAARMEK
jgi:hypothetical protein